MEAAAPEHERLSRGTLLALVAMALGVFLVANDFTALSVALPAIERDFSSDVATVQWVINGYALIFGMLIVTGGRLADMYGRRRMFFVGAGIFAAFSALAAVAPSLGVLLAARAVMGIGGALMWPAVLGMTFATLPADKAGLAGGLIVGVAGIGNAFGPILGGVLTEVLSWRWVFVVNVPVAIFAVVVTRAYIAESRDRGPRQKLDLRGVLTLSAALVGLLLALDLAPERGWLDPLVLGLLVLFGLAGWLFWRVERRAKDNALVPADVVGSREFRMACIVVPLFAMTLFSALVFLPQFFTKILGDSALEAGLAFLPLMGTFALVSFASGSLYERLGAKLILSVGAVCQVVGIGLLALIEQDWGYAATVPGMVVLGVGVGLFVSTVTTTAVTSLDESRASLGGAILYMFQVGGGAVGLGITTTVFAAAAGSSGPSGADLVDGLRAGFAVDFAVAAVGAVLTVLFLGGRLRGARG